ncbi:fibronectin type III-like domain-contianing protein [Vibrio sp. PP-XX7]
MTNKGSTPGEDVVQLYISAPEVKLAKPAYELKAFAKTKMLQPGESQRIKLRVSSDLLASFDPKANQWIVEPGNYSAYISPIF